MMNERQFIIPRSSLIVCLRGMVSMVSTSVSKTEGPSSSLGTPVIAIGAADSSRLKSPHGNSGMEES